MKKVKIKPVRVKTFTEKYEYKLWAIYRDKIKNISDFTNENTKLNDLELYVENELNEASEKCKEVNHEMIREAYLIGIRYADSNLKKLSVEPFSQEDIERINEIEGIANVSIKGVSDRLKTRILEKVRIGVTKGLSIQNIMKEILPELRDKTRFEVLRIARTEAIRAVASGTLQRYRTNEVKKVRWLDGQIGACPECAQMDGREFTLEEAEGMIPLHPMCRCCWTPVT